MTAVILAGGKGRRLQPYTSELPKPLVPIAGTPIIEILLRQLVRTGVSRAIVALGHGAEQIRTVLGDGSRFGIELQYVVEDEPLSTVGPLTLIEGLPDFFLAVNGDILTDLDFGSIYNFHIARKPALTVATCTRMNTIDYGVLDVAGDGRIIGFTEKPRREYVVSAGIYVYSRDTLRVVPRGQPCGFDTLMHELLGRSMPVGRFEIDGYWLDVGRPDDYERANLEIESLPHLLE